jgi:U32 family peptidase
MKEIRERIEIMAPVGSFESLASAIKAGANSVYFGIEQLNMRSKAASNFTVEDLKIIVERCKEADVKTYLALNTVMYTHDMPLMKKICETAKEANLTAVIASDLAAITYAKKIGLEVHISTQQNVTNYETVEFFSEYADVVVLAREVTLKQVREIHDKIVENDLCGPKGEQIQIELFAHGALCVAISGKCYMSLATYNSSANRGACRQNCRRSYKVTDEETGVELVVDNKYIMSPKDLCTIGFVDQILDAGVSVLKLEGRGRSADYVRTVTRCYREAVDAHYEGTYTKEKIDAWIAELETVYNRGFWHGGYYLGKQLGEWSGKYGSQSTHENVYIGRVSHYFAKTSIAEITIETGEMKKGQDVLFTGPTTGALTAKNVEPWLEGKQVDGAKKGDAFSIPVPERVRPNDKVFLVLSRVSVQ